MKNKEDIICVNGKFEENYRIWCIENNVKVPIEDKIYSIRDVVKHSNGATGLLLNEINNPKVDAGFILTGHKIEPTFSINRFRTLQGNPILTEKENILETIDNYTTI